MGTTEETFRAGRLPPLLWVVLAVACGGRYASTTEGGNEPSGGGRAGSTPTPDDDEPKQGGGVGTPTRPGYGGASTGSGGGGPIGGTGIGFAGTFALAGAPIGTAGTNGGEPTANFELCTDYCEAYTRVCFTQADPTCSKVCFDDLSTATPECFRSERASYECLRGAFEQSAACDGALALAFKLCGSDDGRPPLCLEDGACQEDIFGDGSGCHAMSTCKNGVADLFCEVQSGTVVCTCLINGTPMVVLPTDETSFKAACVDDELRALCMKQLP